MLISTFAIDGEFAPRRVRPTFRAGRPWPPPRPPRRGGRRAPGPRPSVGLVLFLLAYFGAVFGYAAASIWQVNRDPQLYMSLMSAAGPLPGL
jgi:hypothetical protein